MTGSCGPDGHDGKDMVILNRVIRYVKDEERPRVEYEPDMRHADIIVKELGLENANGVDTPSEKRSVEQQHRDAASPLLSKEDAGRFRSLCMRAAYLAQDRMDIAEATKTLARNMASPNEASWRLLKRLGRYLKKYPRCISKCSWQEPSSEFCLLTDSD